MKLKNLFSSFSPKKKGPALGGEFNAWEPIAELAKEEALGNVAWTGEDVEAVETKTKTPPAPTLQQIFGDLFERLWVKAAVPNAAPRQNLLAQSRTANAPAPAYAPMVSPTQTPGMSMLPTQDAGHLNKLASDWGLHKDLVRFTGYAFRGDGRDLAGLKAAGGFSPPSTRNDDAYIKGAVFAQFCSYMQRRFGRTLSPPMTADKFLDVVRQTAGSPEAREAFLFYSAWRDVAKSEELHLGRMLAEEALKGYISTTRAVTVAKGFACKRDANRGWVYCVAVLGGFVVPSRSASQWTKIFGEQEIAKAGSIGFHAIAAARETVGKKFVGDLLIRDGFDKIDPDAFKKIYRLLSGQKQ